MAHHTALFFASGGISTATDAQLWESQVVWESQAIKFEPGDSQKCDNLYKSASVGVAGLTDSRHPAAAFVLGVTRWSYA